MSSAAGTTTSFMKDTITALSGAYDPAKPELGLISQVCDMVRTATGHAGDAAPNATEHGYLREIARCLNLGVAPGDLTETGYLQFIIDKITILAG